MGERTGPHPESKECVSIAAQYIFDRFGKFPGTVPSIFNLTYLQAHHLELEFYDHGILGRVFSKGTQADHMARWHGVGEPSP